MSVGNPINVHAKDIGNTFMDSDKVQISFNKVKETQQRSRSCRHSLEGDTRTKRLPLGGKLSPHGD